MTITVWNDGSTSSMLMMLFGTWMASLNLLSAYGGSDSESDTTETEECLSRKKDDEVPTGGSSVTTKRTNFFDVPNEPSSSDE